MPMEPIAQPPYQLVKHASRPMDLLRKYEIPAEERDPFLALGRIYSRGSVLIREGDTDKTLYLLRSGAVGVYRQIGEESVLTATIEALNFVGEMSSINGLPRSATVKALTEDVLVYAIEAPDLPKILTNQKWAQALIWRFGADLTRTNEQMVAASEAVLRLQDENTRLREENTRLKARLEMRERGLRGLFGAALALLRALRDLAVIGSKGWHYVNVVSETVRSLAQQHYATGLSEAEEQVEIKKIIETLAAAQKSAGQPNLAPIYDAVIQSLRSGDERLRS